MTRLETVYDYLYNQGVYVDRDNLNGHIALSMKMGSDFTITINKSLQLTMKQEFSAVIHEEGHYDSGTTHFVSSPYQLIRKHEYNANRRAVLKHINIDELKNVMREGLVYIYQLAEHFDVTDEFMETAIKIYRRMGKL